MIREMKVQIDQSNKIEQTQKDTVIALSNGVKFTVLIRAKDKRVIQNEFRLRGEPRNFIVFTFSALLVFLLGKVKPAVEVIVDREYKEKEDIIREKLILYSKRLAHDFDRSQITFKLVGKGSPAHKLAGKVAARKQNPDWRISAEEMMEVIFPKRKIGRPKGPRSV